MFLVLFDSSSTVDLNLVCETKFVLDSNSILVSVIVDLIMED